MQYIHTFITTSWGGVAVYESVMELPATQHWKLKTRGLFLFLFFGMKKSDANIPLFMNMAKEKRSSEISLLSKNSLFWLYI